jgi:hypothetical protein
MSDDLDRTASLMTPAKLAQMKPKSAASPSAFLDQMATDAGELHVRRLGELAQDFATQARGRDISAVELALSGLAASLPSLDFGLLKPRGWLDRATGKAKTAGAEFEQQVEAILQSIQGLKKEVQQLGTRHPGELTATDRIHVEFEVEYRAIDKIIDQGARWLQDMRNQLKARQAAATDDASRQQVHQDAARCELLVARLKKLRGVGTAAQQAHQQSQAAAARRLAVLQAMQKLVATEAKEWESRVVSLGRSAADGGVSGLNIEGPQEIHADLGKRLEQGIADCRQLQAQEKALADAIAVLGQQVA